MNSKIRGTDTPMALENGRIVLPDRVVTGQALVIEAGRIAGLADPADLGSDIERVDVAGSWITPGLIDIHTHGALRHTFNEPDPEAWTVITAENLRRGTTALLATFAPTPDLAEGLAFCRQWMRGEHERRTGPGRVPGKPLHQRRPEGRAGRLVRARRR